MSFCATSIDGDAPADQAGEGGAQVADVLRGLPLEEVRFWWRA